MINVDLVNRSTLVHDGDLHDMQPGFQAWLDQVIKPAWNIEAKLFVVNRHSRRTPHHWPLFVLDYSDVQGALGYHDVLANGLPYGRAFAGDDMRYGLQFSVTLTHELGEMLVDPGVDQIVQVGRRGYAKELCDAVEGDEFASLFDGIPCSDIVLPSYFDPNSPTGPFDSGGYLHQNIGVPGMLPGGYLAYEIGGLWHDVFARTLSGRTGTRAQRQDGRRGRRIGSIRKHRN